MKSQGSKLFRKLALQSAAGNVAATAITLTLAYLLVAHLIPSDWHWLVVLLATILAANYIFRAIRWLFMAFAPQPPQPSQPPSPEPPKFDPAKAQAAYESYLSRRKDRDGK
jgi:hypothetical protein